MDHSEPNSRADVSSGQRDTRLARLKALHKEVAWAARLSNSSCLHRLPGEMMPKRQHGMHGTFLLAILTLVVALEWCPIADTAAVGTASIKQLSRRAAAALFARGGVRGETGTQRAVSDADALYEGDDESESGEVSGKPGLLEELGLKRSPSYPDFRDGDAAAPFVLGRDSSQDASEPGTEEDEKDEEEEEEEEEEEGDRPSTSVDPSRVELLNVTTLEAGVQRGIARGTDPYSVPLFVMLPLDTITDGHAISHEAKLRQQLTHLKEAGVTGVMVDVWWGICERAGPGQYVFDGYVKLAQMCRSLDLQMQAVMSFHQCGGNVGDTCHIPLPEWVLAVGDSMPDVFFRDSAGNLNREVLSIGVDTLPIWPSSDPNSTRTSITMYEDFMTAFSEALRPFLGSTIVEVQVGLGPAGELRYPSYPSGRWHYPGIGQFQCYDRHMLASLQQVANATKGAGPDWGVPPSDDEVGHYNSKPWETSFWQEHHGGWESPRGKFFMTWYSGELLKHGDRVIEAATRVFEGSRVLIAGKVAGIHWWYFFPSHAAEMTAGYHNCKGQNGYLAIAQMFAKHGAVFDFTCLEMRDGDENEALRCGPATLVGQVRETAWKVGCKFAGENALPIFGKGRHPYEQILWQTVLQSQFRLAPGDPQKRTMCGLTFLRLHDVLFQDSNWGHFRRFCQEMSLGVMLRESEPLLSEQPSEEARKMAGADGVVARLEWALHKGIAIDTELVLPGGEGFVGAHAAVLAAQSPYFSEALISPGEAKAASEAMTAALRLDGLDLLEADSGRMVEGHREEAREKLRRAQADAERVVLGSGWRSSGSVKCLVVTLKHIRRAEGLLLKKGGGRGGRGMGRLDALVRCALALVDTEDHRITERKLLRAQLKRVKTAHVLAEKQLGKARQEAVRERLIHEETLRAAERRLVEEERRRVAQLKEVRGAYKGVAKRLDELELEEEARRSRVRLGQEKEGVDDDDDDEEDELIDFSSSGLGASPPPPPSQRFRTEVSFSAEPPTCLAAAGTRPVFKIRASTDFGQVVKLVGGWKGVGSWQVAQGLVMSTSSEAYPEWSVRPDIPMEEGEFEYKFVKVGEFGDAVWELGPNRRLIVEQKYRIPHAKADKEGEPIEGYCLEDPEEGMSDDPLLNGEDEEMSAMSDAKGEEGREEGAVSRGGDEAEEVEDSQGAGGMWREIRDSMMKFEYRLKTIMKDRDTNSENATSAQQGNVREDVAEDEGVADHGEEAEEEGEDDEVEAEDGDLNDVVAFGNLTEASLHLSRSIKEYLSNMEEIGGMERASQAEMARARAKTEQEVASLMAKARDQARQLPLDRALGGSGLAQFHLKDSSMQMFRRALSGIYTGRLSSGMDHCREVLEGVQRFCVPSCQLLVSHGQVQVNLSSANVLSQARPSEDKARQVSLEAGVQGGVDSGGSSGVVARLEDLWRQGLLTDVVLRTPDDATCDKEEVRAHAAILCSSSPRLRRLIIQSRGLLDPASRHVAVVNVTRCGFKNLLKAVVYCYTGSVSFARESEVAGETAELWMLAVRLGLGGLEAECEKVLTDCMSRPLAKIMWQEASTVEDVQTMETACRRLFANVAASATIKG